MVPRTSIFNMFGPSPLRPLEKHMSITHHCVEQLVNFFDKAHNEEWEKAQAAYQQIAQLEREADKLQKEIRINLPKNLFLPVSRTDLITMLMLQDRIANKAKDIAGIALGRKMKLPEIIYPDYIQLLKRSIDATEQARRAINELDELLEAGFRGKEASLVESMIEELDKIESDTDKLQIKIRAKLFEIENQYSPVDVIFYYKIIEWTGDLADRAQTVGGQFELLLAH